MIQATEWACRPHEQIRQSEKAFTISFDVGDDNSFCIRTLDADDAHMALWRCSDPDCFFALTANIGAGSRNFICARYNFEHHLSDVATGGERQMTRARSDNDFWGRAVSPLHGAHQRCHGIQKADSPLSGCSLSWALLSLRGAASAALKGGNKWRPYDCDVFLSRTCSQRRKTTHIMGQAYDSACKALHDVGQPEG